METGPWMDLESICISQYYMTENGFENSSWAMCSSKVNLITWMSWPLQPGVENGN